MAIININQQVHCRLTETGKDVYQAYLDQFRSPRVPKEAPAEITLPLWEFAQIFGPVLFNGQTAAPFVENNELELIED